MCMKQKQWGISWMGWTISSAAKCLNGACTKNFEEDRVVSAPRSLELAQCCPNLNEIIQNLFESSSLYYAKPQRPYWTGSSCNHIAMVDKSCIHFPAACLKYLILSLTFHLPENDVTPWFLRDICIACKINELSFGLV